MSAALGEKTMNKSQLIDALAKTEGITVKMAEIVISTFFDQIAEALAQGNRAEVRGLCSFHVKRYQSYTGRNPKTGEVIAVREKKLPFCKIGKELKERVDA